MADIRKPKTIEDAPGLAGQDWDDVEAGVGATDLSEDDENLLIDEEVEDELPEEDDDNPNQDSDDALPDDAEERVLRRNPGETRGRFGEV